MKLLLDTHTVLWFASSGPQLSSAATLAIVDPNNEKFVSAASYWEVAIKISTGKYSLTISFEDFWKNTIDMNAFQILHILPSHAAAVATLPFPSVVDPKNWTAE